VTSDCYEQARTPRWAPIAALCLALAVGGCAATQQAPATAPSGFLGDYSQLRQGQGEEWLYVFFAPGTDFASYDKIIIDPVTIWVGSGQRIVDTTSQHDLQRLANNLQFALRETLAKDFEIVESPGPDVMRLRVALTEAGGSNVVLDLVTALPGARMLSSGKKLVTGTHAFVGKAGIEGEILDSQSGRRIAAAVDRRAGGKRLRGSLDTWNDVQEAFDYWAKRLRARLWDLRGDEVRRVRPADDGIRDW
jgi:hypothetical protein